MKEAINDGTRIRLVETALLIVRRMQIYPPPPPRSKYVRTYRFKNAWRTSEVPGGVSIRNAVTDKRGRMYPVYVVGDAEGEGQAQVHAGRWPVFARVTDDALDRLPVAILQDISRSTNRSV
jgi:hypothetical protein